MVSCILPYVASYKARNTVYLPQQLSVADGSEDAYAS